MGHLFLRGCGQQQEVEYTSCCCSLWKSKAHLMWVEREYERQRKRERKREMTVEEG